MPVVRLVRTNDGDDRHHWAGLVHSVTHGDLKKLKTAPARQEVCGDRVTLFNHGFAPVSFAYPFGSFDSGGEQIVAAYGFPVWSSTTSPSGGGWRSSGAPVTKSGSVPPSQRSR